MEVEWRLSGGMELHVCGKRVEAGASTLRPRSRTPILRSPNRNWPSASEKWVQLTDLLVTISEKWVGPVRASLS